MKPFSRSRGTLRRRPRRGDLRSPAAARRAVRSAAWPARRAAWAIEEKLVWGGAEAARAAVNDFSWPLERLIWLLRKHLVWRVQDWFRAWGLVARSMFVLSLLWIGAVACLTGIRMTNESDPGLRTAANAAGGGHRVAVNLAGAPAAEPRAVLHGAPPTFAPSEHEATASAASTPDAAAVSATSTSTVGVPSSAAKAPRGALRVARRFAAAFVLYEVGKADPDVRLAFRETATLAVVRALAERPPRQPAGVAVPEARVLNVVPGPRHGPNLSVSVSLVRLETTSELRLQLERTPDGWLVSDVRG